MKRFLLKIALFLILAYAFDFAFGQIMTYVNNHTVKGDYGRNNYICKETYQDILIFGSSRAIHHYNTDILTDKLGLSCYNCGEDGMGIICSYGRYSLIKQRYQPKMVIYDIEVSYDILKDDNTKYLGFLRPYYDEEGIDSIFDKVSHTEKYKMLSYLYRYNSRWLDILAQFRSKSNVYAKDYKYAPLTGIINYETSQYEFSSDEDCDPLKLYYLEKFIRECQTQNTKIVFVISPVYGEKENHILKPFADICSKYNIPILDHFSDHRFVDQKELFSDKMHLNENGANKFSEIIATEVKELSGKSESTSL